MSPQGQVTIEIEISTFCPGLRMTERWACWPTPGIISTQGTAIRQTKGEPMQTTPPPWHLIGHFNRNLLWWHPAMQPGLTPVSPESALRTCTEYLALELAFLLGIKSEEFWKIK